MYTVVCARGRVTELTPDVGHGLYTNYSLDGEVCLVGQGSSEVVGADLVSRNQSFCYQKLCPLV